MINRIPDFLRDELVIHEFTLDELCLERYY